MPQSNVGAPFFEASTLPKHVRLGHAAAQPAAEGNLVLQGVPTDAAATYSLAARPGEGVFELRVVDSCIGVTSGDASVSTCMVILPA